MDNSVKKSVVLEDCIMQKDSLASAGSKILENFISPLDAAVVTRLAENNIPVSGRVKMDEFGIESLFTDRDDKTAPAVKAVAEGKAAFALCNDVFGKYRRQAAKEGLCYIHPTYGTVSRYGLIPLVCSMDQIGVVCQNLEEGFGLLEKIAGKDQNDGAMFPDEAYEYKKTEKEPKIGVPADIIALASEKDRKNIADFVKNYGSTNIELKHFDKYKQVMYILSCAEISNNINRYDGIKFGFRAPDYRGVNDLYIKTRTQGFGTDTKLASVTGAMVLSQEYYLPYYDKAMRVRNLIKASLSFDNYDIIVLPTEIKGSPYDNLALFAPAPLAGLPCVSFNYKGSGIQLIAAAKNECKMQDAK